MSDSCRTAIYSDAYYDLIIDDIGGYPKGEPLCYQRVNEQIEIGYYARAGIPELNLNDYPYYTIPKCFGLTDLTALEVSGILRLQNSSGLDLNGQGVLVGFVDTGIDYTNFAFRNLDGSTRIAGIWDQTAEDGEAPEGFSYGAFYGRAAINEALSSENPHDLVPVRDELGHGTFLAGVACGGANYGRDFSGVVSQEFSGATVQDPSWSMRQDPSWSMRQEPSWSMRQDPSWSIRQDPSWSMRQDPPVAMRQNLSVAMRQDLHESVFKDISAAVLEEFLGAAPQAEIAVVKCKQAKQYLKEFYFIPDDVPCYAENDLILGMAWLMDFADSLELPLVLCIGMGSSMGSHAGEDICSVLAAEFGRRRQRAVVVSAGNEANARHHYQSGMPIEGVRETVEISVGENVPGFFMELWASVPEIYRVAVISPGGERFSLGDSAGFGSHRFLFEKTELRIDYTIAGNRLGVQLVYFRFTAPYPGIWMIEVTPEFSIGGGFQCWLPLSDFLKGEVYFLRSNPDTTILAPGFAGPAVTVGAYDMASGGNLAESGRGYSALDAVKPDILAPGTGIYGPEPGGRIGERGGTSVAAAITAGGCAQLFQWGVVENNLKYLNSTDLTNLLIRGAVRGADRVYPNRSFGFGLLDVYGALNALRPTR